MPEYYAALNKKTVQLSVREAGFNTTPFEENSDTLIMGPFEAAGKWDAASKARDHFIKEINKCRQDQTKKGK